MINGVSLKASILGDTKASELDKLKSVAKQFEAVFTRQVLKSARSAKLAEDDLFGSDATDQFRDMQDANFADQLAGKGAVGIAALLVKQFEARVSKTVPGSPAAAAEAAGAAAGRPEAGTS